MENLFPQVPGFKCIVIISVRRGKTSKQEKGIILNILTKKELNLIKKFIYHNDVDKLSKTN